ncbi:hypothetical protein F4560_001931 [Saccharothrix ecbatanensis]|uniref:Syndecan 1 n=1 Tax=Saccharothrix ecbatanensis TaxID=1105145 RepID=A0A7W9HHT0_9PSEU|nr:hypothetical protein [Saccharothrix ecbatanensis]MBB5802163.1 hypothetical protein [Saccharothrix ecbatanensis]
MVSAPKPVQQAKAPPATPVTWSATVQRSPNRTLDNNAVDDDSVHTKSGNKNKKSAADQSGPQRLDRSDLDDLARRLLDPVGRLLRAELRHGRERAGILHDRRR